MKRIFDNGHETWVAESLDQLRELYRTHTGMELEDDDAQGDGWAEISPERVLRIRTGKDGAGPVVAMTAAEWACQEPVGFLCCEDY